MSIIYKDKKGKTLAVKESGRGRHPSGANVEVQESGTIVVHECLSTAPNANKSNYRKININSTELYVLKSELLPEIHRYHASPQGQLVDEGVIGGGRPKLGYSKVEESLVLQGIDLKGHWIRDGDQEKLKEVVPVRIVAPNYEEDEIEVDEIEEELDVLADYDESYEEDRIGVDDDDW